MVWYGITPHQDLDPEHISYFTNRPHTLSPTQIWGVTSTFVYAESHGDSQGLAFNVDLPLFEQAFKHAETIKAL